MAIITAIKIALLYWLQQALRLFCPHQVSLCRYQDGCPVCDAHMDIGNRLDLIYERPRSKADMWDCPLCGGPVDRRHGVHLYCADAENFLASMGER